MAVFVLLIAVGKQSIYKKLETAKLSNRNQAQNAVAHLNSDDVNVADAKILSGNETLLRLWKGGIDPTEWNQWVKDNPDGAVDFSHFPFPQFFNDPAKHLVNFKGYDFPDGGVSFQEVDFGSCPVDFSGVNFGNSRVDFSGATFSGTVNFSETDFGKGKIRFDRTTFVGNASFRNSFSMGPEFVIRNSTFKGKTDFSRIRSECRLFELSKVTFKQEVDFSGSVLGSRSLLFQEIEFEEGLQFTDATLGHPEPGRSDDDVSISISNSSIRGNVYFSNVHFRSGIVFSDLDWKGQLCDFSQAIAGGNFIIQRVAFLTDRIDFKQCKFKGSRVQFSHCSMAGNCDLEFNDSEFDVETICFDHFDKEAGVFDFTPISIAATRPITFHGALIDSVVRLPTCRCPQSIDLTNARFAMPLDLTKTDIHFKQDIPQLPWIKSVDPEDAKRFRHLKKLAYETRDVERAIDFYAKEMRASYHHSIRGLKLLLFYLYDWTSDYGRSVIRPLVCLLATTVFFAAFYYENVAVEGSASWQIMQYSFSNLMPIIPGVGQIRAELAGALFPYGSADVPWLSVALTAQSFISAAFLFLIGLALRNRFRS